jgi:hypothetical protein
MRPCGTDIGNEIIFKTGNGRGQIGRRMEPDRADNTVKPLGED